MRIEVHIDDVISYTKEVELQEMQYEPDIFVRTDINKQNIKMHISRVIESLPKIQDDPFINIYYVLPSKANIK